MPIYSHNKKRTSKKGTSKMLILIIVMVIILAVGASIYYLLHQISSPQEPRTVSEKVLLSESKHDTAKQFLENNSLTKEELRRIDIEDKQKLKAFLQQTKISPTEFYLKLSNFSDDAIITFSEEYNLTPQETEEILINILDQMENYPTLKDNDAFQMAKLDFMDYEDKINSKVSLPSAYLQNPPEAGTQVAFTFSGSSPNSFNALLEKQIGIDLSNNSRDFKVVDIIENVSSRIFNSTNLDLEKNICFIGTEKGILLRADYLISNNYMIDYSYDVLVYGPDGKIIPELSQRDKKNQSIKRYAEKVFVIIDFWHLPLEYSEGEYILEYNIYNHLTQVKRIVRVPQKCVRQLLIKNLAYVLPVSAESAINYSFNQTNKFRSGEEINLEFYLLGFDGNFKDEQANLKLEVVILDGSNSIYGTAPLGKIRNITLNKNDVLPLTSLLFIPKNTPAGNYTLLLKVEDLVNNQTARSRIDLEVII
ncbi:MAG: hypothetical protein V2A62_02640 [Candidatus Woesearchaeota archaeon]